MRTLAPSFRTLRSGESTGLVEGKQVDMPATCPKCGKVLMGYAARPWQGKCKSCREEVRRH